MPYFEERSVLELLQTAPRPGEVADSARRRTAIVAAALAQHAPHVLAPSTLAALRGGLLSVEVLAPPSPLVRGRV